MNSIIRHLCSGSMGALLLFGSAANAQVTGTIPVQINLTQACEVNGNSGSGVEFGQLNFGNHSALFTSATATLMSQISILCSVGVTPTLEMSGGGNDGQASGNNHAMVDSGGTLYVGYTVFRDASMSTEFNSTTPITLSEFTDDTPQTVQLWGEALGNPGNLKAGAYTDTLNVSLTW